MIPVRFRNPVWLIIKKIAAFRRPVAL